MIVAHSLPTDASPTNPIIDLDTDPFVPDELKVEEHQKGGQFNWDASKVKLYFSKKQRGGSCIRGHELREELKDKSLCNANLLDYLLINSHLIPKKWMKDERDKKLQISFWGTIYRSSDNFLCVRQLSWLYGGDGWHSSWLHFDWDDHIPAAVFKS